MSLQSRLSDLITSIGTDYKQIRTWMFGSTSGTLANLTTTDKTSLVHAINEVRALAGVDAVTEEDLDALKEEILGAGVPAALDTLDELAAALGDDANFASTVTTALAARVLSADIGNPDTDLVALYTAAKA
jgi:hypothetical protein